jgi:hypothetical protein
MHSSPRTAHRTPVQFQGTNKSLHMWLHVMTGSTKVNRCDSYEKHPANFREQPHGWSHESAKHPKPCEKHGGEHKTARGENHCTNEKLRKKKRNILHEVNRDRESTSLTECAYTQLFLRIKKIKQSYQKILQRIEKRSHRHTDEHDNSKRECSRKSKKACRHSISPDTSSHLRQVKTGEIESNIYSNLNNEIISKPVNSNDLKNLNNKM